LEGCDVNLCIITTEPSSCVIDPCVARKPTEAECGISESCVVKAVGTDRLCVTGVCGDLSNSVSCGMNEKCIYSKSTCSYNECRGQSESDCKANVLCYVDENNNCVFDLCSEGSGLNDAGAVCSSLEGCGYEAFDDTCKISTSKFTSVNVGSIQGIVCDYDLI
jgi:hypothetical protein